MKKLVCVLCCIVLVASLAATFVGCAETTPRENILKLYVPGEYIDEDIFEAFEEWYEQQTNGETVKVVVETFEAVEDIKLAVVGSRADYDLLCPSDYMIEYLIKNGYVKEIDKDYLDITKDNLFLQDYLDVTAEFDPTLSYSVPYMYGTLGLVYNIKKTGKQITSWSALFGSEYAGSRSIKDSVRDAYAAVCIYNAAGDEDAVATLTGEAQKAKIQSIFNDTSNATIAAAKKTFLDMKTKGDIWDVDQVKFAMAANENGSPTVALMWSCDAGYVMNTYEDESGEEKEGNRDLYYVVPDEGGNVYLDSFVISKYARNVKAANYFLQFICQKEIAIQNSEYAGAISPVTDAYNQLKAEYTDPNGKLKGTDEQWRAMFIETMFPSKETLNRCGVMKDFGDKQDAIASMISSIK